MGGGHGARCSTADVVPNLPGSCHNSFTLWQSGVQNLLKTRQTYAGWLLGKHVSQGNELYLAGRWINYLFLICKNHLELSLGIHVKNLKF